MAIVNEEKTSYLLNLLAKSNTATLSHSLAVANLMLDLGAVLRFDKLQMADAYTSGLLHDIGKLGIEQELLFLPRRLSRSEHKSMQMHVQVGKVLLEAQRYPITIIEACAYHHERWDGQGYPTKIGKDEIPLMAQMLALCDTYDALVSDRSYRPRVPHNVAINIMKKTNGQFNPELLEHFFKIF